MKATQKAPIPEAKLVAPFIASVRAVFNTAVGMEITVDRPYFKSNYAASYAVTTIIGFSGEVQGSMTMSFQSDSAVKVVAAFAQMDVELDDPDFADAIGELSNMIAGGAKRCFGAHSNITIPTVIVSAGHCIARRKDQSPVVIPCSASVGEFMIELAMKRSLAN